MTLTPRRRPSPVSQTQPSWWLRRCGAAPEPGPEIEIVEIGALAARVQWATDIGEGQILTTAKAPMATRKCHVDVYKLIGPRGDRKAIASFEADGDATSLQLPFGTLRRASGPYTIEVTRCPLDGSSSSFTGVSEPFWTQPEAPGPVLGPELLRETTESEVSIRWGPPIDDGGSPVEEYEVVLVPVSRQVLQPEPSEEQATNEQSSSNVNLWVSSKQPCLRTFSGLPPGRHFRAEVRAMSAAGLVGPSACVEASTLVDAPGAPTALAARILGPSEAATAVPCNRSEIVKEDVDMVSIEFFAPLQDGGRPLESFFVYASVEQDAAEEDVQQDPLLAEINVEDLDLGRPGLRPLPLCILSAASAASPGDAIPGCRCSCTLALELNQVYTFSIVPFNGSRTGKAGEPAPRVRVPAKPPPPLDEAPQARRVDEGQAAELHWRGLRISGGLPVLSFTIGVLAMEGARSGGRRGCGQGAAFAVEHEVVVDAAAATENVHTGRSDAGFSDDVCTEPLTLQTQRPQQTMFRTQVDGLEANVCYRFALAVTTALGTSPWSPPSRPAWTLAYLDVRQGECRVPPWLQDSCNKGGSWLHEEPHGRGGRSPSTTAGTGSSWNSADTSNCTEETTVASSPFASAPPPLAEAGAMSIVANPPPPLGNAVDDAVALLGLAVSETVASASSLPTGNAQETETQQQTATSGHEGSSPRNPAKSEVPSWPPPVGRSNSNVGEVADLVSAVPGYVSDDVESEGNRSRPASISMQMNRSPCSHSGSVCGVAASNDEVGAHGCCCCAALGGC